MRARTGITGILPVNFIHTNGVQQSWVYTITMYCIANSIGNAVAMYYIHRIAQPTSQSVSQSVYLYLCAHAVYNNNRAVLCMYRSIHSRALCIPFIRSTIFRFSFLNDFISEVAHTQMVWIRESLPMLRTQVENMDSNSRAVLALLSQMYVVCTCIYSYIRMRARMYLCVNSMCWCKCVNTCVLYTKCPYLSRHKIQNQRTCTIVWGTH